MKVTKKTKRFIYMTLAIGLFFAISDKIFASVKSVHENENKTWVEIYHLIPGYIILAGLIAYIIIDYSRLTK